MITSGESMSLSSGTNGEFLDSSSCDRIELSGSVRCGKKADLLCNKCGLVQVSYNPSFGESIVIRNISSIADGSVKWHTGLPTKSIATQSWEREHGFRNTCKKDGRIWIINVNLLLCINSLNTFGVMSQSTIS